MQIFLLAVVKFRKTTTILREMWNRLNSTTQSPLFYIFFRLRLQSICNPMKFVFLPVLFEPNNNFWTGFVIGFCIVHWNHTILRHCPADFGAIRIFKLFRAVFRFDWHAISYPLAGIHYLNIYILYFIHSLWTVSSVRSVGGWMLKTSL